MFLVESPNGTGKGGLLMDLQQNAEALEKYYETTLILNCGASLELASIVETINKWIQEELHSDGEIEAKDTEKHPVDGRLTRTRELLANLESGKPGLVVFSSIERFFSDNQLPLTPLLGALFRELSESDAIDVLVLAQSGACTDFFRSLSADFPFHSLTNTLENVLRPLDGDFSPEQQGVLQELYEHTGSHAYCTQIGAQFLKANDDIEHIRRMARYAGRSSVEVARSFVVSEILRLQVSDGELKRYRRTASALLKNLSLFGIPMDIDVLKLIDEVKSCFREDKEESEGSVELSVSECLDTLVSVGLVVPIVPDETQRIPKRYSLHRVVRRFFLTQLTATRRDEGEFSFFSATVFADHPKDTPTYDDTVFDDLTELTDHLLEQEEETNAIRGALAITKNFFPLGVLTRVHPAEGGLKPDHRHDSLLSRQVNSLRKLYDLANRDKRRDAFYQHELSWLMNERACAFIEMGNAIDASTCLNAALKLSTMPTDEKFFSHYWILLNSALVSIERGQLPRATHALDSVETYIGRCNDFMFKADADESDKKDRTFWIMKGYRGLIAHLKGDSPSALASYIEATKKLRGFERYRACATFEKHLGDLYRALGRFENARITLEKALAFAELGGQRDIAFQIRVSKVRLELKEGSCDLPVANHLLDTVRNYADIMGMDALQINALTAQSHVAVKQGQLTQASQLALGACELATKNGLTLNKLSSQVQLAEVKKEQGDIETAKSLSATVRKRSAYIGYQLILERAERLLLDLAS